MASCVASYLTSDLRVTASTCSVSSPHSSRSACDVRVTASSRSAYDTPPGALSNPPVQAPRLPRPSRYCRALLPVQSPTLEYSETTSTTTSRPPTSAIDVIDFIQVPIPLLLLYGQLFTHWFLYLVMQARSDLDYDTIFDPWGGWSHPHRRSRVATSALPSPSRTRCSVRGGVQRAL